MKWKMGNGESYQNNPRRHHAASWTGTLLPGSEQLTPLVDGHGQRSAAGEQLCFVASWSIGNVESIAKDEQKHVDNMWALGGAFIGDLRNDLEIHSTPFRDLSGSPPQLFWEPRPRLMSAPELFKPLPQRFHIVEVAVVRYSRHFFRPPAFC
jgi:hypothetical protein